MPTDFFGRVMLVFSKYGMSMLQGALISMESALAGTVIGCLIGFAVGIVQTIHTEKGDNPIKKGVVWAVKLVLNAYVEFFRGTPMMAQAMFIYYGLFPLLNINMTMLKAAIFILSINTGAYMAESVRGGIISIDPGQTEGAKAIGMNHVQTMTSVILPQALRNIMPQIGNNFIINVKDTSVMFIISFTEFFAAHRYIVGVNNMYFPSAAIEMIGYLCMTLTASIILRLVEKLMDGSDNYELVQADALTMTAGTYTRRVGGTPNAAMEEERRSRLRQALKNRNGSTRGDR